MTGQAKRAASALAPAIREALAAAALPPAAARAFELLLAQHDRGHVCPVDGVPHKLRMFGPGLPYGPNCPLLAEVAQALGVPALAQPGGWS